jgi:hypothetical protein
MQPIKPPWASLSSWMAFSSVVVGALLTSGLIADGTIWFRIIGVVQMILSAFGYQATKAASIASVAKSQAVAALGPQQPKT